MRKRSVYCVLGVTVAVVSVLLLVVLPVASWNFWVARARQSPWVFSVREAIDINSGDVVRRTYVCGVHVSGDIQRSAFSKELRRVGVKVPPVRNWEATSIKVLSGKPLATENLPLIQQCDAVLDVLNFHKASDTERSVLLAEALGILQTGDRKEMSGFLKRLTGKHDWESGVGNSVRFPSGGDTGDRHLLNTDTETTQWRCRRRPLATIPGLPIPMPPTSPTTMGLSEFSGKRRGGSGGGNGRPLPGTGSR